MTVRAPKLAIAFVLAFMLLISNSGAALDNPGAWMTEPGVAPPGYAVTVPLETDVNVDIVVLTCVQSASGTTLELDLYLTGIEPLMPDGANPALLKDMASVEIDIDGRVFPADLLFTDGYVLVVDAFDRDIPQLSSALLNAMQSGSRMVMRFDLLEEGAGQAARFDGVLVIDLAAGQGAVKEVRRCALPVSYEASR